jgi:hypothetical protein
VYRVQKDHTETSVCRVEVGSVEHVVAQMAHEQSVREVTMERFGYERVFSYFVFSNDYTDIIILQLQSRHHWLGDGA